MSRGPDAATLLERALLAASEQARCGAVVREADWTRWASATFVGARHLVVLQAPAGAALDAWLQALPEAEFSLRGHLVADLVVADCRQANGQAIVTLEALTVEDR